MKNLARSAIILFAASVLASCDLPRTSQQICDCRFLRGEVAGEYTRLEQAPSHFNEVEFWSENFGPTPYPHHLEYATAFRNGTTHWYRNDAGESFACRVAEGSDRLDAYIVLSADKSQSEPLDSRVIGSTHRRPRPFWKKCND